MTSLLKQGQKRGYPEADESTDIAVPAIEDDGIDCPTPNKKNRFELDINDVISGMSLTDDVDVKLPFDADNEYLKEENTTALAITEYVGKHGRVCGVAKKSDVQVHEISNCGKIVRLTNFDLPEEERNHLQNCLAEDVCGNRNAVARGDRVRQKKKCLDEKPSYTEFVLYKENLDTIQALKQLAQKLSWKPRKFTCANIKNGEFKSFQLIRVHSVEANKLLQLNGQMQNMKLGNFIYKNSLMSKYLTGSHFKIIVRNLESEEKIDIALNSMQEKGFINYFDKQHFGWDSISNCEIGKALLLGNWEEAINLIMSPKGRDIVEYNSLAAKIQYFWSLSKSKGKDPVNESILMGLSRCLANDHIVALKCIPYKVKSMYVESYQNYLWNHLVSRRIQKYGLDVLDGDLFYDKSEVNCGFSQDTFPIENATPKIFRKSDAMDDKGLSIEDVVMPLPGSGIIYPDNEIASMYRDTLAAEGFDMDHFRRDIKMVKLVGSYRKIVLRPMNMSWHIQNYDDVKGPRFANDWEPVPKMADNMEVDDGLLKALMVEFSLPSNSYATMAMREVLKLTAPAD